MSLWLLVPSRLFLQETFLCRTQVLDRELLAVYSSLRYFCFLLEGPNFTLFTNHKPLKHTLFCSSPPWSIRQQHHLAYISELTSDIAHMHGTENAVTDALSRPSSPSSNPVSTDSAVPCLSDVNLGLSVSGFDFSTLPAL